VDSAAAPPSAPPTEPPSPGWRAWTSIAALASGLVGAVLGGSVVAVAALAAGADLKHPPPSVDIVSTIVQDVSLVGAALVFARMAGRPTPGQFGLRATRLWPAVGWVAGGYVTFLIASGAWVSALGIHDKDQLPDSLSGDHGVVALVAVIVLVTVLAPIAEELFFRGYFFTALRSSTGVWVAAAITGLFFGALHAFSAPIGYLVPLAFFGFVLCVVYWRTGSLYPCIGLHAINNSLAFAATQGWDWQAAPLAAGSLAACAAIVVPVARSRGGDADGSAMSRLPVS